MINQIITHDIDIVKARSDDLTSVARVGAYFSRMLGCQVSSCATAGLQACESHRRLGCEEGYGGTWPVLLLGTGNSWWLSLAPGLLSGLRRVIEAMCIDGLSGYAITNKLRPELPTAYQNNARWQSSFLYVPSRVPRQHALSPDCAIRPITPSEKSINVPLESIEAGTTVGLFVDDALVSWVEATPLPTVTEHFGVMLVGIETMEGFRHSGYASAVLGELTRRMLDIGRVPLYACAQNNIASQRTALSCGYIRYGECYRLQLAVDR